MNATWLEHQSRRSRLRFDGALVASLCFHALILSLQIGISGFGLPGVPLPPAERPAQSLTVQIAQVRPVVHPTRKPRETDFVVRPVPRKLPPVPRKPPPVARKIPKVIAKRVPQKRELALNEPRDPKFVVPPPTPPEVEPPKKDVAPAETPVPPQVIAEEQPKEPLVEEPRPLDEAREEVKTPEEAPVQEEAKSAPAPDTAEAEQPVARAAAQEGGREAEQASQGQAQAESPVVGAPHFALDIEALRQAEEDARERLRDQQRRQEARKLERERAREPVVEKLPEPPPVTEARPLKLPGPTLPCDDAEALYLAAQNLERNGDLKESFRIFKQAGECGYGLAQRKLGDLYGTGNEAVFRDYQTSLRWYRKARDQGIEIPNKPPRYGYR